MLGYWEINVQGNSRLSGYVLPGRIYARFNIYHVVGSSPRIHHVELEQRFHC